MSQRITTKAETNDATQLLKITGSEVKPGKHSIEVHFTGKLNERPQGLYLTRYQLPNGEGKKALVTQMEPTDARRMFPCWDEPVFRATYQLTAVVPAAHTALSNMPAAARTARTSAPTSACAFERRTVGFSTKPGSPGAKNCGVSMPQVQPNSAPAAFIVS